MTEEEKKERKRARNRAKYAAKKDNPEFIKRRNERKRNAYAAKRSERREYYSKWQRDNAEALKPKRKAWRDANAAKVRGYVRKWTYGITYEEHERMYREQGGLCLGCKKRDAVCVDHDHVTGLVRGLLCKPCNSALGFAEDSVDILTGLAAYLDRHAQAKCA